MTTCRGWQAPHEASQLVEVRWSYPGARQFPSVYFLCIDCATLVDEWVEELERNDGIDLQFRVRRIRCALCNQIVGQPGPWCDLYAGIATDAFGECVFGAVHPRRV